MGLSIEIDVQSVLKGASTPLFLLRWDKKMKDCNVTTFESKTIPSLLCHPREGQPPMTSLPPWQSSFHLTLPNDPPTVGEPWQSRCGYHRGFEREDSFVLQPAVETKNASFARDMIVQRRRRRVSRRRVVAGHGSRHLNVVNLDLLAAGGATLLLGAVAVAVLVELEAVVAIALGAAKIRLVDLGGLGKLTIGLERTSLVGVVLEDDVALLVLVRTERKEDNVTDIYPHLLSELALGGGQIWSWIGRKVGRGRGDRGREGRGIF